MVKLKLYQFYNALLLLVAIFCTIIFFLNCQIYNGKLIYYIIFTIISFFYLFYNLYKIKNFTHLFLSLFIFLGFWFKYSFNSLFNHSRNQNYYAEGTGNFDFSPTNVDDVLIVSSISILALIVSNLIKKFHFKFNQMNFLFLNFNFFSEVKILIIIIICIFNLTFNIYNKGLFDSNNNIYIYYFFSYFYQIGFFFILAIYLSEKSNIINSFSKKSIIVFFILALILISHLSRNILIFLPFLTILLLKKSFKKINLKFLFSLIIFVIFVLLVFSFSNSYRSYKFYDKASFDFNYLNVSSNLFQSIKNRFVGIDAVMAVHAYENKNLDLYINSWKNIDQPDNISYFDQIFLNKKNLINVKNSKFIIIPGFVAHLYYSGSIFFVFIISFLLCCLFSYFESLVFRYYKSLSIVAIFSYLIVYRLVHFGYNPSNLYLYVIAILGSLLSIKVYDKYKK